MAAERAVLDVVRDIARRLPDDCSTAVLAARAGWSPSHLHRTFRRVTGETPKAFTARLRLDRAAARLLTSDESVLRIALDGGYASPEVFTRAFRRRFGQAPARWRASARGLTDGDARSRHRSVVETTAPCLNLFHLSLEPPRRSPVPTSDIVRTETPAQPVLLVRRRIARSEIAATLGSCYGAVVAHAGRTGAALAGPPFARYPEAGPGLVTIEAGLPLATAAAGDGEIEAGVLGGGPAAMVVHTGPYEELPAAYAALERWIVAQGEKPGGAPWESYVTDPADHPDPADWRTEVYWPLA